MATATLLCKQCNFENEPERVYCHNCGAKLDRALLPPEATKREDPQAVQKRVRTMVQPRRVAAVPFFKNLMGSLLVAALLAVLIAMAQPPVDRAPMSDEAVIAAPPISDNLEDLLQTPGSRPQTYTENQVNGFLLASLHGKSQSTFGITTKYERTFVRFQEGLCRTTLQFSIFGYSLYFGCNDGVEIRNGQLVTHPQTGSIGRLQIPASLMPMMEKAPLWAALDPLKKLVVRLGALTFHPGHVVVAPKAPDAA